jgi:hypothetical protein
MTASAPKTLAANIWPTVDGRKGSSAQAVVTAGTILHRIRTPLTVWFWAAYLMTTDKRGLSALLLAAATATGQL